MSLDVLEAFDHNNRKPNSIGLNNKESCLVVGLVLRWANSVRFSRFLSSPHLTALPP